MLGLAVILEALSLAKERYYGSYMHLGSLKETFNEAFSCLEEE
jgi:hypothetical protein